MKNIRIDKNDLTYMLTWLDLAIRMPCNCDIFGQTPTQRALVRKYWTKATPSSYSYVSTSDINGSNRGAYLDVS